MGFPSVYNQKNQMNSSLQELPADGFSEKSCKFFEQRKKSRIDIPFLLRVRGENRLDEVFEIYTSVKNLSASGLYMMLGHEVAPGAHLFVVLTLATSSTVDKPVARIALRGVVQRAELGAQGLYGIAIKFTSHRFL